MAVIVPFRDRDSHLRALLRHLIPILRRQLVHFRIFVVEQVSSGSNVIIISLSITDSLFACCLLSQLSHSFVVSKCSTGLAGWS